jgi:flagellar protein FliO/FliZ
MDSGNMFLLVLRVVVSLAVVIGLMWLAAATLRRTGRGGNLGIGFGAPGRHRSMPIEVVARHGLGRRSSVALVRAAGRGLVLGVTDTQVTLLAETDPDDLLSFLETPDGAAPLAGQDGRPSPFAWKAVVDALREKSARRG